MSDTPNKNKLNDLEACIYEVILHYKDPNHSRRTQTDVMEKLEKAYDDIPEIRKSLSPVHPKIWIALFHKENGELEFAVDTIIEPQFIPRIGETMVWDKRRYEITHIIHDFCQGAGTASKTRQARLIKIVGKEIEK